MRIPFQNATFAKSIVGDFKMCYSVFKPEFSRIILLVSLRYDIIFYCE